MLNFPLVNEFPGREVPGMLAVARSKEWDGLRTIVKIEPRHTYV